MLSFILVLPRMPKLTSLWSKKHLWSFFSFLMSSLRNDWQMVFHQKLYFHRDSYIRHNHPCIFNNQPWILLWLNLGLRLCNRKGNSKLPLTAGTIGGSLSWLKAYVLEEITCHCYDGLPWFMKSNAEAAKIEAYCLDDLKIFKGIVFFFSFW